MHTHLAHELFTIRSVVCVCAHTYAYTLTHMYIFARTRWQTHMCVCHSIYVYMCEYVHACMNSWPKLTLPGVCVCACMYAYMFNIQINTNTVSHSTRLAVYVSAYICVHTQHIYVCIHSIYVYAYTLARVHIRTNSLVHMCQYVYVCICLANPGVCVCSCMYVYTLTCTHSRTCSLARTCESVYAYVK